MKKPILQIGNGNWAVKDSSILGYVEGDTIEEFKPRFLDFERGTDLGATRVGRDGLIEKGRENLIHYSNSFAVNTSGYGTFWTKSDSYRVVGGQVGYDGTNNAWLIDKVKDNNSYIYSSNVMSLTTGVWTYSIYAKAGTTNAIWMYTGSGTGTSTGSATFVLEGEGHIPYKTSEVVASNIENLGNGWYRCSYASAASNTYKVRIQPVSSTPDNGSNLGEFVEGSIYVQNPQVEVGVAPTAPIVTGSTSNILRNSFDIEQSPWGKTATLSITRNQLGYDGTQDAFKLTKSAQWDRIYQEIPRIPSEGTFTVSAYVKADDIDAVIFRGDQDDEGDNDARSFECRIEIGDSNRITDQETGTVGKITKVGDDGWYRAEVKYTTSTSYDHKVFIYPATYADGAGGTTGSIFIQDVQVEFGENATDYQETSALAGMLGDQPRIDYSDTDPHLLMEPTRANLIPYSEYSGDWSENFTGTLTQNTKDILSPEGVYNAFKMEDTSTTEFYSVTDNITVASGDGGEYTLSVFVKKTTGSISNYVGMQLTNTHEYVFFNTSTGDVTESVDPTLTSNTSKSAESFDDNWWRLIITNTLPEGSNRIGLWPAISSNGSTTNTNPTGSAVFYGWQLEKGSFATSYIPTHGASVTRDAEGTGQYDMQDFFDGNDFTLFVDLEENPDLDRDGALLNIRLSESDAFSGSLRIYRSGTDSGFSVLFYPNNSQTDTAISLANATKIAIRRVESTGVFTAFTDGVSAVHVTNPHTDTNFGQMRQLRVQGGQSTMKLKGIKIYDKALTDAECIELTS